jgi:hypothetical protein
MNIRGIIANFAGFTEDEASDRLRILVPSSKADFNSSFPAVISTARGAENGSNRSPTAG